MVHLVCSLQHGSFCHRASGGCGGVVAVDVAVDQQGMSKRKQEKNTKFNMPSDSPCTILSLYKTEASHTMFATGIICQCFTKA